MDRLDLTDATTLGASLLAGCSVLLLIGGLLPSVGRRRAIVRHLRAAVEVAADADASGPATDQRLPIRLAWSRLTAGESSWLKQRILPWLPFIVVPSLVFGISHQLMLTIAAELQVWMFASLLNQNASAGRSAQLDRQMLPTILRLNAAIRSGASLHQALEVVAEDAPSPTREAFASLLDEVALGASLDTALEHLAERVGTPDYMILSLVLTVQRRVGGNLPQVLERIAEAVRERIEFRRHVAVLTSQQRMSTWILALLPFFVAGAFFLADRSFLAPLVTTTPGHVILLVASGLQLVGGWALRWAGRVDV